MKRVAIAVLATFTCLAIDAGAAELTAQTFAEKVAQSDRFEIQAAKLVVQKGHSEKVKAFAQNMLSDHGKSTKGLMEAAAKDGVGLRVNLGNELQKKLNSLKPLSGVELDAAYVSTQVSAHSDAVELFDKYSKDGPAGALKSFAVATYPTIRMHLVRIRSYNIE